MGALSLHWRDRLVHHHVRGLIAVRGGRWAEGERHFATLTRAGAWGWTRALVELARAQMAQGRARDAVATLRRAYPVPPENAFFHVSRSELDHWMAAAFRQAGLADSAAGNCAAADYCKPGARMHTLRGGYPERVTRRRCA